MENTPNYNMNLPDYEDFADVEKLNENFEIIDTQMKTTEDALTTHLDKDATLEQKGHVQLSNAVADDQNKALTPKAVNDLAWQKHKLTEPTGQAVNLFTDVSLDTITSTGFYRAFFTTALVGEVVVAGTYSLIVISNNITQNAATQTLINENTKPGQMYTRSRNASGTWSKWLKHVTSDITWIEATPQNGWQQHPEPQFRLKFAKDSLGFVHIQGDITGGVSADDTIVTTLPIGYRPSTAVPINAVKADIALPIFAQVSRFGEVVIYRLDTTGTLRFGGSFYAGV